MQEILNRLSPREVELLRIFKTGASNREIATSLQIKEKTVRFHLLNVYAKFSITNGLCHHKARKLLVIIWQNGLFDG